MAKKPTPKEQTEKADVWKQRYEIAVNNQQEMFTKFSKWFDLMHATVNDDNMALWRSKVFIPIMASKAWNLISKFVGLKPGFEVSVRDPEPMDEPPEEIQDDPVLAKEYEKAQQERVNELKKQAERVQKKLAYDYDNPKLDESIRDKMLAPLVDAVVTGTGIAKVPWNVKKHSRYERMIGADGTVNLKQEKVYESSYGCNDLIPVNIFNVFVAPTATNLYSAPWIIIKEYKTKKELEAANESMQIYKNLGQLENARAQSDEFSSQKRSRNRLVNSEDPIVQDKTLDLIAVYECYEGDMIYTYADSGSKNGQPLPWVEIRRQKNPYWHGKYPLVRFQVKQRPHDFWGEGIFETTERLQSAVNDVFNHYMDNYNLSNDGLWLIDENSNVENFVIGPGQTVYYSGTAPQPARLPEPNPSGVQLVNDFLNKAIDEATISAYATGMPNSAVDKTQGTATGIMRLQDAAGDLISFMRENFQQSIRQIGNMWLSNNKQFLDRAITIPEADQQTIVKPQDFQADMELRVDDASMTPVSKEDARAMYTQFIQQTLALQQASVAQSQISQTPPLELDYDELFRELADKFGVKGVETILINPEEKQEQILEEQASAPGGMGMPATMPMMEGPINA